MYNLLRESCLEKSFISDSRLRVFVLHQLSRASSAKCCVITVPLHARLLPLSYFTQKKNDKTLIGC